MNPITIIGGGLAGLSLGIALRKREINVRLFEAGSFPRHKVCGEFIAGVEKSTLGKLGIARILKDAGKLRQTSWFYRRELRRVDTIPRPALSISRYTLDHRLADCFVDLGGTLFTRKRIRSLNSHEGSVWASGRQASGTKWIGLKLHCFDFPLQSDLELHLGEFAYAGASKVEGGRVNICGLFRKRPHIREKKHSLFLSYLRSSRLNFLADRISASKIDPESICGVSAFDFNRSHQPIDRLNLGDQFTVIPPFTGNGMSMAFEAAVLALDPLVEFSRGKCDWMRTVSFINRKVRSHFRIRLAASRLMHPFLYHPIYQQGLVFFSRIRMMPFNNLFDVLH